MTAVPRIGKTRYLPVRETICPPAIEVMSSPAIRGRISRPEVVGDAPLTTWKYSGKNVIAPNMAKPTNSATMPELVNTLLENRREGAPVPLLGARR